MCFIEFGYRFTSSNSSCFIYLILLAKKIFDLQFEILNGLKDKAVRTVVGHKYLMFDFGSKTIPLPQSKRLIFKRTVFEKTDLIGGPHWGTLLGDLEGVG